MLAPGPTRVAVVGAGISGIAAAHMLKKNGYQPVVFEKSATLGGVWALAYPDVRLQNIAPQYHLSDFPWPFKPDFHPTRDQILRYLRAAIERFQLDVRVQHEVLALEERDGGWLVRYRNQNGIHEDVFGYAVVAVGQYTEGKHRPAFPGQAEFAGAVLTEREIRSLDVFNGKRVAVVGFGKSALDMATFAAARARQVFHVFRTPRWLVPEHIFGVHVTVALFTRFGTVMMPSWTHPTAAERLLHKQLGFAVDGFWRMIESVFRYQVRRQAGRNPAACRRIEAVLPQHRIVPDLRSAAALEPAQYYRLVAQGRIQPVQSEPAGFSREGLLLKQGDPIACDLAVLSLGSQTPSFPFLPSRYRRLLETEEDGAQLYRHLIHPRIPRLGFAGFNHSFMHVPSVEVGTLWLCALWRGELDLPSLGEMEQCIEQIRAWKRAHVHFEPSRACATSTRFQQYLDILLMDLGVSPYRKLPNPLAEVFARYSAADYRGVLDEYNRARARRTARLRPLPLPT